PEQPHPTALRAVGDRVPRAVRVGQRVRADDPLVGLARPRGQVRDLAATSLGRGAPEHRANRAVAGRAVVHREACQQFLRRRRRDRALQPLREREQLLPPVLRRPGACRKRTEPQPQRHRLEGREADRAPELARRPDLDPAAVVRDPDRFHTPRRVVVYPRRYLAEVLHELVGRNTERLRQLRKGAALLAACRGHHVEDPIELCFGGHTHAPITRPPRRAAPGPGGQARVARPGATAATAPPPRRRTPAATAGTGSPAAPRTPAPPNRPAAPRPSGRSRSAPPTATAGSGTGPGP